MDGAGMGMVDRTRRGRAFLVLPRLGMMRRSRPGSIFAAQTPTRSPRSQIAHSKRHPCQSKKRCPSQLNIADAQGDGNVLGMQGKSLDGSDHPLRALLASKVDFVPRLFHLLDRLNTSREVERSQLAFSRALESPMNLNLVEGRFSQRPVDYP